MCDATDASSTGRDPVVLAAQALTRMFRMGKQLMRASTDDVHPELSPANVVLLVGLAHLEPCRVARLAEHHYLDASTVSRQVDHLVGLGLVERTPDPRDRRATLLARTPEARLLTERIDADRLALWRRAFATFDEAELAEFVRLHNVLTAQLDSIVEEASTTTSACADTSHPARPNPES